MSLFALADVHLSLGTDKPMDIFPGWTDYVDRLERNWRDKVAKVAARRGRQHQRGT